MEEEACLHLLLLSSCALYFVNPLILTLSPSNSRNSSNAGLPSSVGESIQWCDIGISVSRIHTCMHAHTYERTFAGTHAHMHTHHACTHTHTNAHLQARTHTCTHTMHACTHILTHTCRHERTHARTPCMHTTDHYCTSLPPWSVLVCSI